MLPLPAQIVFEIPHLGRRRCLSGLGLELGQNSRKRHAECGFIGAACDSSFRMQTNRCRT